MRVRLASVAALVLAASLAVGAAGAGATPGLTVAAPKSAAARERQMKAVVRAWSQRLNAGDNAGIAKLFALPSVVIQGPYAWRFHTRAQLAEWHSGLPCSGQIVSIAVHGRYALAVFRLGDRGSTKCDAPGSLAAARFEIVNGKIVLWRQVPVPAKQQDNGPVT
jgi:hypothetical protein